MNDNKSTQDSCPGWKSYIHICSWREEGKNLLNAQRPFTAARRMAGGFVLWKGLRGERWGTLTSSLWEQESHINCSIGRLPSLSKAFRRQVPGEIAQARIKQLNTYLMYCSLKVSAKSWENRGTMIYLKSKSDVISQKHACHYLRNELSLKTCRMAQGW